MDPTPRANADQWRFTPSLLDPNSFAFTTFANQPPGYYTPTPGGTNTIYHPQAGDLHTPGFTLGLGTPLSLPTSEAGLQMGHSPSQSFHPQTLAPHVFQNPNPFAFQHQQPMQHAQTFAPHQFTHQPAQFTNFQHAPPPKIDNYSMDVDMQEPAGMDNFASQELDMSMHPGGLAGTAAGKAPMVLQKHDPHEGAWQAQTVPKGEFANEGMSSFRYHVTLNAPTAMIKHPEEIPITYLNKGQTYSLKIVDTKPMNIGGVLPTFRTFVRISFESEQQRQRPAQCWQLWKEGRGTSEAHHRGGRLQAVEFVDPKTGDPSDAGVRPQVELETSSFDGFSVKWTPAPHGPSDCQLTVRFNFLSTDFSHSKGVKGIPVRLCAKTQMLSQDIPLSPTAASHEICYCKVKLFRDHGAERKLTNDIAHVKKSIDKLKQQIQQAETGIKDFGKRKRSESGSKSGASSSRPGKVPKHKRTWSMSSASDTGNKTSSQEDDLQTKLQALQDMFTSTRPASVLFLKGDESDDPDLNPVQLSETASTGATLSRQETNDSQLWEKDSTHPSSIVSPPPSQRSVHSQHRSAPSTFQRPAPFQPSSSAEWLAQTATGDLHPPIQQFATADGPSSVQTAPDGTGLARWIETLGVDQTYQPPPERVVKPGKLLCSPQ